MRREENLGAGAAASGQLLLDLRLVAMNSRAIGLEVLVQLRVLVAVARFPPRSRDAGLRIDHDRAGHPVAEVFEHRLERHRRRGRVAARIGDQPRARHRVTTPLGEPVDGFRQQVRRRVLRAVPAPVGGRIPQPEVGAEINHPGARIEQPGRSRQRLAVRQSKEHDIGVRAEAIPVGLDQVAFRHAAQVRENGLDRLARAAARRKRTKFHVRVVVQPPDQFRPAVAGRPGDRCPNHKAANNTPQRRTIIRAALPSP